MAAAEAADERMKSEADIAYRGAQQRQADAATEQARANTALLYGKQKAIEEQQQRGSVGELLKTAANMHGISPAEAPDFASFAQTGQMPGRYEASVDGVGPVQPTPGYYTDGTAKKLFQTLGLMQQALTVGDKSTEKIAKATGMYRDQALGDDVLAGRRTAGQVGEAQAAMGAKKIFDNIGDSGSGYNMFTGSKQVLDPGLVAIFGDKAAAQIAKENAQAGASKASAAHSYASAAKTRQDMELGAKGTPTMTDQGLLLVDPRGGTARAVIGPDGQPVGPKLKDIPPSVNTAIVSNMQNLAKAQAALDLVSGKNSGTATGDKNATGLKGYLPNGPLNYFDPKGVDARAAIADLGSMVLHERSGANVTASESPRLMPFIPLATDDPETIKKKLQRFIQVYKQETDFMGEQYNPSQGYKASPVLNRGGAPNTPDPLGLFSR